MFRILHNFIILIMFKLKYESFLIMMCTLGITRVQRVSVDERGLCSSSSSTGDHIHIN